MITNGEACQIVNDLFEEEALVLGALFAVHRADDDLIWRLMKNLESLRANVLRRIAESDHASLGAERSPQADLDPHPAIAHFLTQIRKAEMEGGEHDA